MYPYNRLIVRRSWYLSSLDTSLYPKHAKDEERYPVRSKGKGRASGANNDNVRPEPVHGDELEYEEAMVMPNQAVAWVFSFTIFSFFALYFTSSIVSLLLGHWKKG
jgi:hypothetical protein